MTTARWSLSADQRHDTVRRTSENLFALAYARGNVLTDKDAADAAAKLEEKAYTVARIESQTTSGHRPYEESLQAYVRKLAALLVEWTTTGYGHTASSERGTFSNEVLDLVGEREFLTKAGAVRALSRLLDPDSRIKRVKLSTKSFGLNPDNSAEIASQAFEAAQRSLTDVDMSDVIAGRPEEEALAALRIMSAGLAKLELRRLDLSDNALGEKGIRACSPAFTRQACLEYLAFQNVGCSINACAALNELLQRTECLTALHLHNNMSDCSGAASIAEILTRCGRMTDFKMASSRVGAAGGVALARALRAGHVLERLDLSDNPMTADVAEDLAALIASQPRLRSLNLNDTSLGDDGVAIISRALESSAECLEELELALNEITPASARALEIMLPNKQKLKLLNLRENELGNSGAASVATGISKLTTLSLLDLTQNQIGTNGAVPLVRAAIHSHGLTLLALDENELSATGIASIKNILERSGMLASLGPLDDNEAPSSTDEDASTEDPQADSLANAMANARIS